MAVLQINKKVINGAPAADIGASGVDTTVAAGNVQHDPNMEGGVTDADTAKGEKGDIKMVIQGPLSHMYTRALLSIYALEEANVLGDGPKLGGALVDDSGVNRVDIYAVGDGDLIHGNEGVAEAGNRLKLALDQMGGKAVLAVECAGVMTESKARVLSYMGALGVSVVYSPRQLCSALRKRF